MSEIIIEGHKVDTKDIWDIDYQANSRGAWITIKIIEKPNIVIGRNIPYESYPSEIREYHRPYDKLYQGISKKWEADKSDLPVFKL